MVGGFGGLGGTCPASNGGRRSCGGARHLRGVPRITNKKTIQVQKDRVLRGLGTDARATGGGEGLAGIGGKRRVQYGRGGSRVSCGPRRTVNVTKTGKWMEKKKTTNPAKKKGLEKKEKLFSQWCSGGSTHDPNQEGSESRPLNHRYLRKGPT